MPVTRCSNGKYRIGDGPCMYTSEENANEAYRAYLAAESKSMIYGYKNFSLEVKDVDKKEGVVAGYFSAFNTLDSDGDIIRPGAFAKSINEWFPKGRIKHLLNHDIRQPLGKITVLKEDEYGLYYESKIGTNFVAQDFLKMVESDLVKEHSIGFQTIREQKGDTGNEIFDVKLYEGSSLTAWGANEHTPLMGVKSLAETKDRLKSLEKFVRNTDASDECIEMCLIEIKQLYQLVHTMSSKPAVEKTPVEQKSVEQDIHLLILKHF
jgi:HK97 family phage prohead protease